MAARPWTTDDDARLRELAGSGISQRQIAVELGRSKSAVDRRTHFLGIAIDRTFTQAATDARVIDATARRAALRTDLLGDAVKVRAQLWQTHTYFDWCGKDHDFGEHTTLE